MKRYIENGIKIINEYGPTESTVKFSHKILENADEINCIGGEIENLRGYILDKNLNLLPIGAVGELYIGGEGVARGYLNREELTKERFIKNPYQTEEEKNLGVNGVLYKTGDLVRELESGEYVYLGRNDNQIKIRGYRIELGEIENAVLRFNGVLQTAVIAKSLHKQEGEGYDENKSLVCYFVEKEPESIDIETLKQQLANVLPEYMVPQFYVKLEKLPLNSSGKLDKKALPEPQIEKSKTFIAPRNELERDLCRIWEDTLGLPAGCIGIYSNFFGLGGNIILSIKLLSKINKRFNTKIKITEFYLNQNVEKISKLIKKSRSDFKLTVELNYSVLKKKMFMVHPAHSGSEVYLSLAEKLASDFHCIGIENYNLHHENRITDLSELIEVYLNSITEYVTEKEEVHLLGWSLGGYFCLEMAKQLEEKGYQHIFVYLLDTFNHAESNYRMDMEKKDFIEILTKLYQSKNLTYFIEDQE